MKKILILLSLIVLTGCLKKDRFPYSSKSAILNFTFAEQSGATAINSDSLLIVIPFTYLFSTIIYVLFNLDSKINNFCIIVLFGVCVLVLTCIGKLIFTHFEVKDKD